MKKKEILTLALLVAILPPAWAVASPYFGVKVGPIADSGRNLRHQRK